MMSLSPLVTSADELPPKKTLKKTDDSKLTKAQARTSARLKKVLKKADRAHRRKSIKGLKAAIQSIVRIDSEHPAAAYYQALVHAFEKNDDLVLLHLGKLKQKDSSPHARLLPVYRVRARRAKTFRHLLTNMTFRKLVGIDSDPAFPKTAYERLVGVGGTWQDAGLACERAKVHLDLDVELYRFLLVISSRCQGSEDKTRLKGTWDWEGNAALKHRFPNAELGMEDLGCELMVCSDDATEDCLRCVPDPELEFNLRPLRR
jgi:hypothetical protein